MKRKVNLVGKSTLTVSLPSNWVRDNGVKKGDELELDLNGGDLLVSRNGTLPKKEITVDVSGFDSRLIRLSFNNAYRLGFSKMIVKYSGREQFKYIRDDAAHYLPGFELIRHTAGECIIENILQIEDDKYEVLFKRIFYITYEMMQNVYDDISHGKKPVKQTVVNHYRKINQYVNFCVKILNQEKEESFLYKNNMLYSLLLVVTTLRRLAIVMQNESDFKVDNDVLKFYKRNIELFHKIYESYFRRDIRVMTSFDTDLEFALNEEMHILLNKKRDKINAIMLTHFFQLIRFIDVFISPASMDILMTQE